MPTVDIHELLRLTGIVANTAGALGIPVVGLAGTLAVGLDQLIQDLAVKQGVTREEIIAATNVQGAAVLLELAKDAAEGV